MYPSWSADAESETSGTSRTPSAGTPGPVCHKGLLNTPLLPPPDAERAPSRVLSFQDVSGMYDNAEPQFDPLLLLQNEPLPSLKRVPPTPVTFVINDAKTTERP